MIESNTTLFLVDQNKKILNFLKEKLEKDGFDVFKYNSGISCLGDIEKLRPDLIIMDLNLPNIKGSTLLKELKNSYPKIKTIVLSKKSSTETIVKSFQLGADDYMTKPFAYKELLVRIRKRMQSKPIKKNKLIKYKNLTIDTLKKKVFKDDKYIKLTHKEYSLLEFLIKNKGRVYSRDRLLELVWGMDKFVISRTVDVYIGRLRKRLGDENYIRTRRGFGYMVEA